ncbi:hypothetical protein HRR83_004313 [Exophiala dermatitidis]|uniref:C6 transcription factor n=2 Tax=Exophiala dermatitidis TaxID=5970 RepID=H6BQH3_EXODN|nr:uncharacterized protein HMPREF1120_02734 [Exophiala dermatitidis NIH/UT8656]KAJ4511649.1 hypothetical protein HRR73_006224 [Exophiala dermatitidis]EHY54566.1 hypothetical protein HMPREF1120_02734 [Exophiala dermatitidis NIH/UT8656]KAJ4517723.1 hypothetical protein HRR75_002941 [Exophiala dermatitidis]KAJ4521382.1 hypothetical protein HRR74_003205 [Exophiala dermatitidis]KAJ4542055.1 hypothetical protein HRR77_005941 [Exophiala dermatitidis]
MVSTRHHPRPFPESASPARSSRSNTAEPMSKSSSSPPPDDTVTVASGKSARTRRSDRSPAAADKHQASASRNAYLHKPPPLMIVWLCVSLPLVLWDTGYIFCRPYSMPGGSLHWPLWTPYALYGTVDYIYGWPAWNGHVGFTAAQASLNTVETLMYFYYLNAVFRNARSGMFSFRDIRGFFLGEEHRAVRGPGVAKAVVVLFSAAVMTLSKTVLYWLNEYFSGFANIGHNTLGNLILLWIIPNGLWLVFPSYIIYVLGSEMIQRMDGAAAEKED